MRSGSFSLSGSTNRLEPMIKSLDFANEGWFSYTLEMFWVITLNWHIHTDRVSIYLTLSVTLVSLVYWFRTSFSPLKWFSVVDSSLTYHPPYSRDRGGGDVRQITLAHLIYYKLVWGRTWLTSDPLYYTGGLHESRLKIVVLASHSSLY